MPLHDEAAMPTNYIGADECVKGAGGSSSINGTGNASSKVTPAAVLPLHPADKRAPSGHPRTCVRCKAARSTIAVQTTTTYCTNCFQSHFESKARPGLEQAHICAFIHRQECEERGKPTQEQANSSNGLQIGQHGRAHTGRVVLGCSGGPNSRVLLRMARERLLPPKNFNPAKGKPREVSVIDVVYIDDSEIVKDATDRTEQIRAIVEEEGGLAAGLHFIPLRLQDVFESGKEDDIKRAELTLRGNALHITPGIVDTSSQASLLALFAAICPTNTPRISLANARSRAEDLHALLIAHLLRREARFRNASCLLTGENATRRAARTIEGLSRGRGHKMPMEEGSIRWHDVFLLRPMCDVSSKEVSFYLHSKQMTALAPNDLIAAQLLGSHSSPSETTNQDNGSKASISRLTESLLQLLESNVPGTASTVNRTSGKLVFSDEAAMASTAFAEEGLDQPDAFDHVGPTLPLRRRRRPQLDPAEKDVSHLEQSVRGLGLGGMGGKYYLAAQTWPHFVGHHACPLCGMPAQRGLDEWKRGLTVQQRQRQQLQGGKDDALIPSSTVDLSALLCYACVLILDLADAGTGGAAVPMPPYVLLAAQDRLKQASE